MFFHFIIELEGESEASLKTAAEALGLDWQTALHGSVENAYQTYYTVSEVEIDGWKEITFVPVPDWLEPHRR